MIPLLPQNDPSCASRIAELVRARDEYRFDYSYHDTLQLPELPLADKIDANYYTGLGRMSLKAAVNKVEASGDLHDAHHDPHTPHDLLGRLKRIGDNALDFVRGLADQVSGEADASNNAHPVASLSEYDRAYQSLPAPLSMGQTDNDEFFAWQALAGCNPIMLERMTAVPEKLALTQDLYRASVGDHDSLEQGLREGRVFVADYADLEGVQAGTTDGRQKFVWAPIAVYAWRPNHLDQPGALVPVCVQIGQTAGSKVFSPADGVSWRMAKAVVAVADSQVQGLMTHFGACHLVMEAVAIAMKRQLAPQHPLRLLLTKHTENTLLANDYCKTSLTNPGGVVDRLQAQVLSDSMRLCQQAVSRFRLMASSPLEDGARRGVLDTRALPIYPHRDDQILVWRAVEKWIDSYVRLYYGSDAEVERDVELQGFVAELGADDGGRLQDIGPVVTVSRLVDLMARVVFRASAFHATINYSLYDFTYAPNGPTSAFGPGPEGGDGEPDLLKMLPPWNIAYEVIQIYWALQTRLNRLGLYEHSFSDDRLLPALEAFRAALSEIDARIDRTNASRPWPYVFSKPALITESIHV